MPFDGENFDYNDGVLRTLARARTIIESPYKWVQEEFSLGGRYCALGALIMADTTNLDGQGRQYTRTGISARALLRRALPERKWRREGIAGFNDYPGRMHSEVLALYDRAMAMRRAEIEARVAAA